jgi:hypothetical protein
MRTPTEISALLTQITADVKLVVADEIALAKAEIKPMAKRVGVGSGMFGGAAWFAISATIILWFVIAAGFAWLLGALTPLSPYAAVFFGMLITLVLLLVIAGVFVVFGAKSFKGIKGLEKTPEAASQTMATISAGVTSGAQTVADELQAAEDVKAAKRAAKDAARAARAEARALRNEA